MTGLMRDPRGTGGRRGVAGWALGLALVGCAPPDPEAARAAWLADQLVTENRVWLSRDPELVAWKFEKMAADPYDFLRGSAGTWYADLARPDPDRLTTRFLVEPEAAGVLLVGDPHPENLSTVHAGDREIPPLELVDLDAAGFGPWVLDLRRAALGLAVLQAGMEGCDELACLQPALRALSDGWADGVKEGSVAPRVALDADGRIIEALLESAIEAAAERSREEDVTAVEGNAEGGERRLLLLDRPDADHLGLVRLSEGERAEVERLVAAARPRLPGGFRLLDAGRRYGVGVSSYAALRYVLLWDLGGDDPDDDMLLEAREVVDPPALPGGPRPPFADNAERLERAALQLWSVDVDQPGYLTVLQGGLCFRFLPWTSWYQNIDHVDVGERWAEGGLDALDWEGLGRSLGRLLAAGHLGGPTASGLDPLSVLRADLEAGGGEEGLYEELLIGARADRDRLLADYGLFRGLIDRDGPLLGAERLPDDVP